MISQTELREFFQASIETYTFLSHVFFKELNDEAIAAIAEGDFPTETGNDCLDEGYRLIRRYFHFSNTDRRSQLAVEYARIFLAAGVFTKEARTAVPYESVFTSEEHLVMGTSRDDCVKRYLADGFQVNPDLHEPEDHIAFEFEYLAHMCEKALNALDEKDKDSFKNNLIRQSEFIETHLLNWIPELSAAVNDYAKTTFYTGIISVAQGALEQSKEILDATYDQIVNGVKPCEDKETVCDEDARE